MIPAGRSRPAIVQQFGGSVCDRNRQRAIHLVGRVKGDVPMKEWLTENGEYLTETDSEKAQTRLFDRTAPLSSSTPFASIQGRNSQAVLCLEYIWETPKRQVQYAKDECRPYIEEENHHLRRQQNCVESGSV